MTQYNDSVKRAAGMAANAEHSGEYRAQLQTVAFGMIEYIAKKYGKSTDEVMTDVAALMVY